jgi:hypothetical protein
VMMVVFHVFVAVRLFAFMRVAFYQFVGLRSTTCWLLCRYP